MFEWLRNRVSQRPQPALERAPQSNHTVVRLAGTSPRRGLTLRPMAMVKADNRRRTRVERASRKANR